MANKLVGFFKGILLKKEAAVIAYAAENEGGVYNHNNSKLRTNLAGADREIVTGDQAQALTNKTIDADLNTISNIDNADIKALAAIDAAKIHDGTVSNVEFGYLDGVTSSIQVQINTKASQANLDAHVNNATGAHAGTAISNTPVGNLAAVNVQAALNELQSDVDTRATSASLTSHTGAASGAHAASAISNTPAGNLAAIEVQAALNELQTDVDTRTTTSTFNAHTAATSAHGVAGAIVGTTDTQTLTNKTIDGDLNTVLDLALTSLKTEIADASKFLVRNASGVVVSNTKAVPTGDVVGTTDAQVLTAKDIDGGAATNTSRLTIPKASKATLDALTRKQATIVFASDESKAYVDNGTVLIPVGSGGGGGLDSFFTEDFGVTTVSTFVSGNNALFLGGGTLAGTLANDTTTPIRGNRSILYTQAAGSLNDYFALAAIPIEEKQRGQPVGFKLAYKYDGNSSDIKFVAYCATTLQVLTSTLDVVANATSVKFLTGSFNIPSTCTSLRIGFQVAVLNSGKILEFDDVEVSTNPFLYKNLQDYQYLTYTTAQSTLQDVTNEFRLPAAFGTSNFTGSLILKVEDDAANTRTKFTATRECYVSITTSYTPALASNYARIYLNGTAIITGESPGSGFATASTTLHLFTGDFLTVGANGAIGATAEPFYLQIVSQATAENIVTSQTGDDSYIKVYTANGYGSTNTKIRRFTTISDNYGPAITYADSVTLGASFTINSPGVYNISYTDRLAAVGTIGISKNSAALTTDIFTITEATKLAQETVGGNQYSSSCSWTGYLIAGDVIRPHGDGSAASADATIFSITKLGFKSLSAVPLPRIAYLKDIRAAGTSGGTGTAGNYDIRVLNTVEGDSSIVTLAANQFTLQAGTYDIDFQCPCYQTNRNQARLRNMTDSTTAIVSQGAYSDAAAALSNSVRGFGTVTITSAKVFQVQHRIQTTTGVSDFGITMNFTESEIFTIVKIQKIR